MSSDRVPAQIAFEIERIEELLESYRELLERSESRTPSLVERTAIASVLHSFYTGLENIFLAAAKGIDRSLPSGGQWHRDLLRQVAVPNKHRKALISEGVRERLEDYLGFRHYYRHADSFFLDWNEFRGLAYGLR